MVNLTLPLFEELDAPGVAGPEPVAAQAQGPGPGPVQVTASAPAPVSAAEQVQPDSAAADAVAPCPADLPDPLADVLWHPALWRASQMGGGRRAVTPSGFATLDAQLPGQGWPHGELTELLLAQPGIGELRLLAPALATIGGATDGHGDASAAWAGAPRCVMLFEPPAALSAWALAQQGLSHRHWLVVQARAGQGGRAARAPRTPSGLSPLLPSADLLWALEQALRSGQVGAVLAWLPEGLRADALRRLQLAAQSHDGPVFLFRGVQALHRPSAAPLRLQLQPAGVDGLTLRLLKRRGPPLAEPLRLLLPSVLTPHQQARALAQQAVQGAVRAAAGTAKKARASGQVAGRGVRAMPG